MEVIFDRSDATSLEKKAALVKLAVCLKKYEPYNPNDFDKTQFDIMDDLIHARQGYDLYLSNDKLLTKTLAKEDADAARKLFIKYKSKKKR